MDVGDSIVPRPRFVPRPASQAPSLPFDNAEEAWFWFMRCQRARRDGAAFRDSAGILQRPCDPDDIYRAVVALRRQGVLSVAHLAALARFGIADRAPDPRRDDESTPARWWEEALERLATVLRSKGIVA